MQTAIEYGKEFLIRFYTKRDAQESLAALAEDVVWVSPEEVWHFRTRKEELLFLEKELRREPDPRYVDVESVMADSRADGVRLVTYQVNLVPADPKYAVHLRCSMALAGTGETFEITFLHFSRIYERSSTEQIREFTNAIPAGIMILAHLADDGVRCLYHNQYFYRALGYGSVEIPEEEFAEMLSGNPFFLMEDRDKETMTKAFAEAGEAGREFSLTVRLRRVDGTPATCEMAARPAYRDGGNTVYYCLFRDISGARERHTKLRTTAALFAGIVSHLPASICVLRRSGEEQKAVYISDTLPKMLGISMRDYLEGIRKDLFFGLTMTSVTKESLIRQHLEEKAKDPSCGVYPSQRKEGRWIGLSMCAAKEKGGSLIYLTYSDRTEQRQEEEALRREREALSERSRKRTEYVRAAFEREKERMQAGESDCVGLFAVNLTRNTVEEAGGAAFQQLAAGAETDDYETFLHSFASGLLSSEADGGGALTAVWAAPVLREAAQGEEEIAPLTVSFLTQEGRLCCAQAQMRLSRAGDPEEIHGYAFLRDVTDRESLRQIERGAARTGCDYIARIEGDADRFTVLWAREEAQETCVPPRTGSYRETFLEFYRAYGKKEEIAPVLAFLQTENLYRLLEKKAEQGDQECVCRIGLQSGAGRTHVQGLRFVELDREHHILGIVACDCTQENEQQEREALSYRNYYLEAAQENRIKTDFLCRLRQEMEGPLQEILRRAQEVRTPEIAGRAEDLLRYLSDIPEPSEEHKIWKSLRGQVFSYSEMMDGVCAYVRERCREKGIRFLLRPQQTGGGRSTLPDRMVGDRLKLEQALFHLLDNAVKYTAAGGEVTLQTQERLLGADRIGLRFEVRDTGSGIEEGRLPTLFDPFASGARRGEIAPAGSGLGLSVAKDIVRRMGGSIQVRSEKGAGTTFTISVTLRAAQPDGSGE
ncbi:MAG: ATP-binding protein [Eubacteriales bacterium]|nr:ATP-binding protein [Eubacteriales bacterium]